jgi:16S rRNA (guanine(527)-N(7))-methyltransferase GidB
VEQAKGLAHWSLEFDVQLTLDQLNLFQVYLHELLAWNSKTNLTSITRPQEILVKHFVDSIACSKSMIELDNCSKVLDVGSGAGFPGVPLKIAFPQLAVTLLEPTSKKIAFLRHLIGTLELRNARAMPMSLQDFAADHANHGVFSNIISRALDMSQIIDHCLPLLTAGGRLILCRSKPFSENENAGRLEVASERSYDLPCGYGRRILTALKKR